MGIVLVSIALGFLVMIVAAVMGNIPLTIAGLEAVVAGIGAGIIIELRDILHAIRTGIVDILTVLIYVIRAEAKDATVPKQQLN